MPIDIGQTIFADILGMTLYPGAPFTGNLVRDLIMFLFVPSVFIIIFVIVLLGRIVFGALNRRIRILLGIALYMFIVAGGYYPMFAYLAGPYFIFLIFIIGLIYFIPSHFGVHSHSGERTTTLRAHGDEDEEVFSVVNRFKGLSARDEAEIARRARELIEKSPGSDPAAIYKILEREYRAEKRLGRR